MNTNKYLGTVDHFLGADIKISDGTATLRKYKGNKNILSTIEITNYKHFGSPIDPSVGCTVPPNDPVDQNFPYRERTGSKFIYLPILIIICLSRAADVHITSLIQQRHKKMEIVECSATLTGRKILFLHYLQMPTHIFAVDDSRLFKELHVHFACAGELLCLRSNSSHSSARSTVNALSLHYRDEIAVVPPSRSQILLITLQLSACVLLSLIPPALC